MTDSPASNVLRLLQLQRVAGNLAVDWLLNIRAEPPAAAATGAPPAPAVQRDQSEASFDASTCPGLDDQVARWAEGPVNDVLFHSDRYQTDAGVPLRSRSQVWKSPSAGGEFDTDYFFRRSGMTDEQHIKVYLMLEPNGDLDGKMIDWDAGGEVVLRWLAAHVVQGPSGCQVQSGWGSESSPPPADSGSPPPSPPTYEDQQEVPV